MNFSSDFLAFSIVFIFNLTLMTKPLFIIDIFCDLCSMSCWFQKQFIKVTVKIMLTSNFICYILFKIIITCYITGGVIMERYREAYECYTATCEIYGMESVNFHYFIKYLTEEQLQEYSKKAH